LLGLVFALFADLPVVQFALLPGLLGSVFALLPRLLGLAFALFGHLPVLLFALHPGLLGLVFALFAQPAILDDGCWFHGRE
jgi:hypothetical protein